jgi:hypothetical protein
MVTMAALEASVQRAIACEGSFKALAAVPLDAFPQCLDAVPAAWKEGLASRYPPSRRLLVGTTKGALRGGTCAVACVGITTLATALHAVAAAAAFLCLVVAAAVAGAPNLGRRCAAAVSDGERETEGFLARPGGFFDQVGGRCGGALRCLHRSLPLVGCLVALKETPPALLRGAMPLLRLRPDATFETANRLIQEHFGFPGPGDVFPIFDQAKAVVGNALDAWLEGAEAHAEEAERRRGEELAAQRRRRGGGGGGGGGEGRAAEDERREFLQARRRRQRRRERRRELREIRERDGVADDDHHEQDEDDDDDDDVDDVDDDDHHTYFISDSDDEAAYRRLADDGDGDDTAWMHMALNDPGDGSEEL